MTLVYRDGRLVEKRAFAHPARSNLPAPMLIRDCMEPTKSMLDGQIYDSKSRLRATYKAAGMIEVGNDVRIPAPAVKEIDTLDVVAAYRKVKEGYKPPPLEHVPVGRPLADCETVTASVVPDEE